MAVREGGAGSASSSSSSSPSEAARREKLKSARSPIETKDCPSAGRLSTLNVVQRAADVGAITKTNLSLKLSPDRRYLELVMGHKKTTSSP